MTAPITRHTPNFATAPQLQPQDLAAIAAAGFKTVINNRPDGEGGPDQPTGSQIQAAAEAVGLTYFALPVISGQYSAEQVQAFGDLLKSAPGPVVAYCRSGARCTQIWRLAVDSGSAPA